MHVKLKASAFRETGIHKYTRASFWKQKEICQGRELWRGQTPRGIRF
jgi:hypothetical protein